MLRKVGISKMKADTLQVPEGEITLSFDANPEQKEQLKQLLLKKVGKKGSSKRAKLHFIDTLKEMIREELNESALYNRAGGLVKTKDLYTFVKAGKAMKHELAKDGWDDTDVRLFLNELMKRRIF